MTPIDDVIRARRTIHNFQPECPPLELVRLAIESARWAPNHHRTEPWQFHLPGPETVARIIDLSARLELAIRGPEGAAARRRRWSAVPGWLVVSCSRSDDPIRSEEDYAACCCAIQNLSLSLWARGVGVKWTTGGVIRNDEFFQILGLSPVESRIVGLLWFGWPAEVPQQDRKPLEDILKELP